MTDLAELSGSQRLLPQEFPDSTMPFVLICWIPRQGLIRVFVEANLLDGGIGVAFSMMHRADPAIANCTESSGPCAPELGSEFHMFGNCPTSWSLYGIMNDYELWMIECPFWVTYSLLHISCFVHWGGLLTGVPSTTSRWGCWISRIWDFTTHMFCEGSPPIVIQQLLSRTYL